MFITLGFNLYKLQLPEQTMLLLVSTLVLTDGIVDYSLKVLFLPLLKRLLPPAANIGEFDLMRFFKPSSNVN